MGRRQRSRSRSRSRSGISCRWAACIEGFVGCEWLGAMRIVLCSGVVSGMMQEEEDKGQIWLLDGWGWVWLLPGREGWDAWIWWWVCGYIDELHTRIASHSPFPISYNLRASIL